MNLRDLLCSALSEESLGEGGSVGEWGGEARRRTPFKKLWTKFLKNEVSQKPTQFAVSPSVSIGVNLKTL